MNWKVEYSKDGYRILDGTGAERGRYKDAAALAGHLAMALYELDEIQKARFEAHLDRASAEVATWPE